MLVPDLLTRPWADEAKAEAKARFSGLEAEALTGLNMPG